VSSATRFEGAPIRRALAAVFLMTFLLLCRKLLGRSTVPAEAGSTWSEDLKADRRFERSLLARGVGAILLIVLLMLTRHLLS
jgi:hypothetical protein